MFIMIMKKRVLIIISVVLIVLVFFPVVLAFDASSTGLKTTGTEAKFKTEVSLPVLIGGVIKVLLSFLGVVLLLYIVYGGFLYMTAGGEEGKVKTAKGVISNAIIGRYKGQIVFENRT